MNIKNKETLDAPLYSWIEIDDIFNHEVDLSKFHNLYELMEIVTGDAVDYRLKPFMAYVDEYFKEDEVFLDGMNLFVSKTLSSVLSEEQKLEQVKNIFYQLYSEHYLPDVKEYRNTNGLSVSEFVNLFKESVENDVERDDVMARSNNGVEQTQGVEDVTNEDKRTIFLNNISIDLIRPLKSGNSFKLLSVPVTKDDEKNRWGYVLVHDGQIRESNAGDKFRDILFNKSREYSFKFDGKTQKISGLDIFNKFEESRKAYQDNVKHASVAYRKNSLLAFTPSERKKNFGEIMKEVSDKGLTIRDYDVALFRVLKETGGNLDLSDEKVLDEISKVSNDVSGFNFDLVKEVETSAHEFFFLTPDEHGFVFNPQECVVEGFEITEDNFEKAPESLAQFDLSPSWKDNRYSDLKYYQEADSSQYSAYREEPEADDDSLDF